MLYAASVYTVFDDEAHSARLYALPAGEMIVALWHGADPDPPLYYLMQNAWVRLFGVGPLALRSMSIVLFLAALVVVRRAAEAWFDRETGRAALLICALHPAHLFFGFAGRWYALMFLLVSLLILLSAPGVQAASAPRGRRVAWGLCAAAVCYVNYFGPVIVALAWLAMWLRERSPGNAAQRDRHGLAMAAAVAIICYLPWIVPFARHLLSFPQAGGPISAYAASSARLGLTLVTGNLADPSAWWAWTPMGLGAAALLVLAVQALRRPCFMATAAMLLIAAGSAAAGILSRTLIDKYVLIISGPFCILAAALLVGGLRSAAAHSTATRHGTRSRGVARFAAVCIAIGWIGCMANLVTERHWSSLRWLDPFASVTRMLYDENWERSRPDVVCSHPSARYYFALHRVNDTDRSLIERQIMPEWRPTLRTDAAEWLAALRDQDEPSPDEALFALTPSAAAKIIPERRPALIHTLETAGFHELPEWSALMTLLERDYIADDELLTYMEDDAAEWKNRVDPAFRHPRWRITVRRWLRRDENPPPTGNVPPSADSALPADSIHNMRRCPASAGRAIRLNNRYSLRLDHRAAALGVELNVRHLRIHRRASSRIARADVPRHGPSRAGR